MNARFTGSTAESAAITTFHFIPERPVDYIAGQFIEVTLPHPKPDAKGVRRWFTLSSSPTEPAIAITVKYDAVVSSFKQALRHMKPGDIVHISDPLGDFVLPLDDSLPLVWIAGGIGITPFHSMATWLKDTSEKREIVLFHSIRDQAEAIFTDTMKQAGIVEHYLTDTSAGETARLSAKTIVDTLADPSAAYYYISGPEQMVENLASGLQANGISRQLIITDVFLGYR